MIDKFSFIWPETITKVTQLKIKKFIYFKQYLNKAKYQRKRWSLTTFGQIQLNLGAQFGLIHHLKVETSFLYSWITGVTTYGAWKKVDTNGWVLTNFHLCSSHFQHSNDQHRKMSWIMLTFVILSSNYQLILAYFLFQ